jgi:hypothetical protein
MDNYSTLSHYNFNIQNAWRQRYDRSSNMSVKLNDGS